MHESLASTNVGSFQREELKVIRIQTQQHLDEVLNISVQKKIPVYPYSTGKNWGYGSNLPTKNGGVLLDLSKLNTIINVNEEHGLATIEPGVTQAQLASELLQRNSKYFLDVTGSGATTSILGNALERGIAYQSIRVNQIAGLEVLLADGRRIKTGFGNYEKPLLAGLYPHGLGPSIDGLFFQSNLGIVTQGIIKLTLRSEATFALTISVKDNQLSDLIEAFKNLRQTGVITGIPHVADRERTVSTLIPLLQAQQPNLSAHKARHLLNVTITRDWTATLSVTGTTGVAKAKLKEVKNKIKPLGKIFTHSMSESSLQNKIQNLLISIFATRNQKLILNAVDGLRGLHIGRPTNAGIQFLLENKDVDQSRDGFLLCTPLAPLSGTSAEIFSTALKTFSQKYGVTLALTQNIITEHVLEAVYSVHFQKNNRTQRNLAHSCVHAMTEFFNAQGFYPYRINIDQMDKMMGQNNPHRDVVKKIKLMLDPQAIFSPGRY